MDGLHRGCRFCCTPSQPANRPCTSVRAIGAVLLMQTRYKEAAAAANEMFAACHAAALQVTSRCVAPCLLKSNPFLTVPNVRTLCIRSRSSAGHLLTAAVTETLNVTVSQAGCVEALLLSAEAHRAARLPTSALPYALSALHHARHLSLDELAAQAVVALADIWLGLGKDQDCMHGIALCIYFAPFS